MWVGTRDGDEEVGEEDFKTGRRVSQVREFVLIPALQLHFGKTAGQVSEFLASRNFNSTSSHPRRRESS